MLVKAVNKGETSNLGISLLVGGSWLTGSMIGGRMWFDQLAQLVDAQTGSDAGQLFHMIGETAYPSESERLAAGKAPLDADPGFVHLRDARLLTGAAVRVPNRGAWYASSCRASTAGWSASSTRGHRPRRLWRRTRRRARSPRAPPPNRADRDSGTWTSPRFAVVGVGSIRRPRAFQARALPTELSDRGPDGI